MSTIVRPASEALPLVMKMFPNGKTCKASEFLDCYWRMPITKRREVPILRSKCAESSGCKPEYNKIDNYD